MTGSTRTAILTVAMPLIMSVYLGVAGRAATIARKKAGARADEPETRMLAGEMENRHSAVALAVDDLVRLANGLDFAPDAALASRVPTRKTLAANAVIATAEKALELAAMPASSARRGSSGCCVTSTAPSSNRCRTSRSSFSPGAWRWGEIRWKM
ncbi:hypothetical protein [Rhodovulum sp. ES.010]|uniref:hypothetical protein n=1 Tax=Rhodovulum sp. ES.010 TaxID=1882821 RepID=UPI000940EC8F|nr:hypothetical protein [Rhodovulum sp. ES.010]